MAPVIVHYLPDPLLFNDKLSKVSNSTKNNPMPPQLSTKLLLEDLPFLQQPVDAFMTSTNESLAATLVLIVKMPPGSIEVQWMTFNI